MYSRSLFNLSCLTLAVAICMLGQQVAGSPTTNQQDSLNAAGSDELLLSSQHLMGVECGPEEYLAAGKIKSCEPTCKNPNPVCLRMFYASLDHYPCFCKAPLVRETKSNKCIPIKDCP